MASTAARCCKSLVIRLNRSRKCASKGDLALMETLAWVYFYASAFVVVVILSAAARHKVRFSGDFIGALAGYRLLPEGVLTIWWVVPTLEALAVAEILFSYGQSRWLAAALFALYGAAIATNLLRGRQHIDCGCGGEGAPRSVGGWCCAMPFCY